MFTELFVLLTGTGILAPIIGQYIGWGLFLIIFGTMCLLILHDYALYSFGAFVTLVFYMALFWGVNLIPLALAHPLWALVIFVVMSIAGVPWSRVKLRRLADGVFRKRVEELKAFLANVKRALSDDKNWRKHGPLPEGTSEEVRQRVLAEAKAGKVSDELLVQWQQHCATHKFQRVDLSVEVTPDKFKARLFLWFFFWWISFPSWIIHHWVVRFFPNLVRFLRHAWDWIFSLMYGQYQKDLERSNKDIDPRLLRKEED